MINAQLYINRFFFFSKSKFKAKRANQLTAPFICHELRYKKMPNKHYHSERFLFNFLTFDRFQFSGVSLPFVNNKIISVIQSYLSTYFTILSVHFYIDD